MCPASPRKLRCGISDRCNQIGVHTGAVTRGDFAGNMALMDRPVSKYRITYAADLSGWTGQFLDAAIDGNRKDEQ
jgi:hypothetical protein